jgi:sensor histidine kinase regulating citrate/malate metabolism
MAALRIPRLVWAPILLLLTFVVLGVAPAVLCAWTLNSALTAEYESKARALAETISEASAEDLIYGDGSSVQARLDQYAETEGVAYVFVVDTYGEVVCDTFVPGVPRELLQLGGEPHATRVRTLRVPGYGDCIDVVSPVVAGQIGYVHVGMAVNGVRDIVYSSIIRQVGLLCLLFPLGAFATYQLARTDQTRAGASRPWQSAAGAKQS